MEIRAIDRGTHDRLVHQSPFEALIDDDAELHHAGRWWCLLWELEVGVARRAAEDIAFFGVGRLDTQCKVDAIVGVRAG